jgi:hypothetical protein
MFKYCSQNILFYKVFFDKDSWDYTMQEKFYFYYQFFMQKILSTLVWFAALSVVPFASAETTPMTQVTAGTVTASTSATGAQVMLGNTQVSATNPVTLTQQPSVGSSLGEYKNVSCTTAPEFAANSCDQCFDGGSVKKEEAISGLYDNWTNPTSSIFMAYKEEQKYPNMVSFGNTKWVSMPSNDALLWKNSEDITWISSGTGGKSQYILPAGQKVKFYQTDLGLNGYKMVSTDKKSGEMVGMLRFPIVYRTIDSLNGNESEPKTHYECVSYALQAAAVTPTPSTPEKKPTPAEVTQTKTGPETLLLIVAAFFIAFGLMFSLRKRA